MNILKGEKVSFSETHLIVTLNDGRIISTPLEWYAELQKATITQLKNYRFICKDTGIEWPELDYHLSLASMLVASYTPKKKRAA